ncbi:polymer-forming cytoskeletal protein [Candidatus Hydrogenedentota bacterium]
MANPTSSRPESQRLETIIGAETKFSGEIDSKGAVRIDGVFEGKIKTTGTISVGKTGVVKADIEGNQVLISGEVHGNIIAKDKIELLSDGSLFGDIKTGKLSIAEGVVFEGNCVMGKNAGKAGNSGKPVTVG